MSSKIEVIINNAKPIIQAELAGKAKIETQITARGPRGLPGPKGDKPVKGVDYMTADDISQFINEVRQQIAEDKTFVHDQMTPKQTWTIYHGLNKRPAVTIVDSTDSLVIGELDYLDDNTVRISFTAAFSGKAYFN